MVSSRSRSPNNRRIISSRTPERRIISSRASTPDRRMQISSRPTTSRNPERDTTKSPELKSKIRSRPTSPHHGAERKTTKSPPDYERKSELQKGCVRKASVF